MNPIDVVSRLIESLVLADATLSAAIPYLPGWIDVGALAATSDSTTSFPCVRLDGLVNQLGKQNQYGVNVKLWSQDTSGAFLELAERMKVVLASSDQLLCEGYLHRPESALNCALFQVVFYA